MSTSKLTRLKSAWARVCDATEWIRQQVINFVVGVVVIAVVILSLLVIVVGVELLLKDTPFERMGILGLVVVCGLIVTVILPTGKGAVNRFNTWRGRR